VTLSNPVNSTIADGQAVMTLLNDDPNIAIGPASGPEGDVGTSQFTFIVFMNDAYAFPVSVSYATMNGTARRGLDYRRTSGRVTIPPGETTVTVTVTVLGDFLDEPNERFFVVLFKPENAIIRPCCNSGRGTGTIHDDDP
jgi:hypothetical protein